MNNQNRNAVIKYKFIDKSKIGDFSRKAKGGYSFAEKSKAPTYIIEVIEEIKTLLKTY
jgi:hypothetical protein